MAIRIAIADDHPLMLHAIDRLLSGEPDFEVVARAPNGEEALRSIRALQPDVAVLDIRMPGRDGLSVMREMKAAGLRTRAVLLTASLEDEEMLEAARLGVGGVVLKEMAPRLLIQCIRKVHAGEAWFERRAASRALDTLLKRESASRDIEKILTTRERNIARLAAKGLANKEMADELFVSVATVKTHLHNIYDKLGVRSRAELILYCRDRGID